MDWSPIVTASGAIFAAAIAAIGTIYVARAKTKTDISASITTGFEALTNQLQEERKDLNEIIERHRATIDKHRETIESLYNEGQTMRLERREMFRRIEQLEAILRTAGIPIPEQLPQKVA